MPDIDDDAPDIYRPGFIRYVRDRYGGYHAAQIVTFSLLGPNKPFEMFLNTGYQSTNYSLPRAYWL